MLLKHGELVADPDHPLVLEWLAGPRRRSVETGSCRVCAVALVAVLRIPGKNICRSCQAQYLVERKRAIEQGQWRHRAARHLGEREAACTACGEVKAKSGFSTADNTQAGIRSMCKACVAERTARWRVADPARWKLMQARRAEEAQQFLFAYLIRHPCACGEVDIRVLDFDHVDGKRLAVGRMLSGVYGIAGLQREIARCEVRCVSCHRVRTAWQRGFYRVHAI